MSRTVRSAAAAVLALVVVASVAHVRGEDSAPLANARLTHVAVATRDADATARAFADLLGMAPPASRALTLDAPGNQKVALKVVFLNTANFQIELDQPMGPGPTQKFLDTYGQGIQHIGFAVPDALAARVAALEGRGGTLTVGAPGGRFAFVDLTPSIGTTIELVQPTAPPAAPTGLDPKGLASRQVMHVGFVFRDAQPAVRAFSELLGIPTPSLNVFKPIDYLPGVKADPDAHVKVAQFPAGGGINIEVIEPVGAPSPWADHLAEHHGNAPHHIAFRYTADDNFDDAVRMLRAKGGVWKKGKRGFEGEKTGSSPEFEFFDTLGMVIEVTGGLRP